MTLIESISSEDNLSDKEKPSSKVPLTISKKNVLDIGFGEGQNLIECKKRGANVFGIELREKKINEIYHNYKIPKKNLFKCDLNKNFPLIKKKFKCLSTQENLFQKNLISIKL